MVIVRKMGVTVALVRGGCLFLSNFSPSVPWDTGLRVLSAGVCRHLREEKESIGRGKSSKSQDLLHPLIWACVWYDMYVRKQIDHATNGKTKRAKGSCATAALSSVSLAISPLIPRSHSFSPERSAWQDTETSRRGVMGRGESNGKEERGGGGGE